MGLIGLGIGGEDLREVGNIIFKAWTLTFRYMISLNHHNNLEPKGGK